jgi:hypothetical protein
MTGFLHLFDDAGYPVGGLDLAPSSTSIFYYFWEVTFRYPLATWEM